MHESTWLFFAYIDPGGSEFFIQILLGGIFAWLFRFRRAVAGFFRDRGESKAKPAKT